MLKKAFIAMLGAALVALVLCGCASTQGSSSSSSASSSASSASSSAASSSGSEPSAASNVSILDFQNDAKVAKLKSDMEAGRIPVSCNVLYDTMGARPDVDVTDPAVITDIYNALSRVTVVAPSDMSVTDSYHHVSFKLQDGTSVGFSFEGDGLLSGGRKNYQVSGTGELWKLVRSIQDESMSKSDKGAVHSIKIASGKDMVYSCPTEARAGDTVVIELLDVTDGSMVVKVDGEEIGEVNGIVNAFVMPDRDVRIDVTFEDYSFGGGA